MSKPFDDKEDQLSPAALAAHFGEQAPAEKKPVDLTMLSRDEIEKLEEEALNSSDIYRIAARVKNLARAGGGSLTPVGEGMCNLYVHVMKAIYDFGDTLEPAKREELKALLREHENMPAKLLSLTRKR